MMDYEKQATDFLESTGTKFSIEFAAPREEECPDWCSGNDHIHGDKYHVTLEKGGKEFSFNFWNSYQDVKENTQPTAYDVLACLVKYDPGTIDEYTETFGYNTSQPISQHLKNYMAACTQYGILSEMYSPEEMNRLQEIE